jgi:NAD(P)-dependent dehydrogenase (short-subunit alcohol dehydrogenase family)
VTGRREGSAVLVTGGAAGLGLAYARRFLREGACVFIADIVDPSQAVARLAADERAEAKGTPFLLHYVASKGAVIAMTRALARELGDDGIAVNAVAPGLVLSDTVRANPEVTGFQSAAVLQSRAFKRAALPEDVEGAVVFLASPDSAFMTGQTLVVDGGSVFV